MTVTHQTFILIAHDCHQFVMYYPHILVVRNSLSKSTSWYRILATQTDTIYIQGFSQSVNWQYYSFIYCHKIILCSALTINHLTRILTYIQYTSSLSDMNDQYRHYTAWLFQRHSTGWYMPRQCLWNLCWKSFVQKFNFPLASYLLTDAIYLANYRDSTLLWLNLAHMQQRESYKEKCTALHIDHV